MHFLNIKRELLYFEIGNDNYYLQLFALLDRIRLNRENLTACKTSTRIATYVYLILYKVYRLKMFNVSDLFY